MNKYKSNIIAIILGLLIGLIPPISIKIAMLTNGDINLLPGVYFLGKVIPFFAIGYLVTDFIIFFMAGLLISFIKKQADFKFLALMGIAISIIAILITHNGSIDVYAFVINTLLAIVYISMGGLFYKKINK